MLRELNESLSDVVADLSSDEKKVSWIVSDKISRAEGQLKSLESSFGKYLSDPRGYRPQLANIRDSAGQLVALARAIIKHVERLQKMK